MTVTDRLLTEEDIPRLTEALTKDTFHTTTPTEFFLAPNAITKAYELDGEVVLYARACKALILDLEFIDNGNVQGNRNVMEQGFPMLEKQAKENGFDSIIFTTSNPLLQRFCTRRLKFETIGESVLRKVL